MGLEIERKFLVCPELLGELQYGESICQGYIPTQDKTAVRIRLKGSAAFLTLKGANRGAVRSEFEYAIPVSDAQAILAELCSGPKIEKTRYCRTVGAHVWEIDVFAGSNEGLVVAEIELNSEHEPFEKPPWVAREVTGDARYYNTSLLTKPYLTW
ncbi:CYTH domain-containing protein [Halioxenophilus aromaticivorans]|uniref:CYTH domain-containing protein n=1 Tax=Halioxenophilus aromaticivorans TaxID=1306992 RepID=A0AAV3TXG6_9ALTE